MTFDEQEEHTKQAAFTLDRTLPDTLGYSLITVDLERLNETGELSMSLRTGLPGSDEIVQVIADAALEQAKKAVAMGVAGCETLS